MKHKVLGLAVAISMLVLGGRAYAHHSFAATYIVDQTATVEGTMVEFLYRNPHSFVKVEATDAKGQVQTWALEWGGAAQLSQDHVTKDQLRIGDHVIVTGNPARDPSEHRMRIKSITRPSDGWKWQGVVQ
jgi:hypothetical protein